MGQKLSSTSGERVCVMGLWHLGLVTSACLAEMGWTVTGFTSDLELVEDLARGELPLFEPGLQELVERGVSCGRLRFTADPREALEAVQYVVIAYDTKVSDDDESDLSDVWAAAAQLAEQLEDGATVIVSSQVPVGTCERIEAALARGNSERRFVVACVPENLRLGQAIERFMKPDLLVVGARDAAAARSVEELFKAISAPRVVVSIRTAEMTKHALNAFLATCVSFANELAGLCEEVGADALEISRALRLDSRIGPFAPLRPGLGFAGGTLARDLKTLRKLGETSHTETPLLDGVLKVNERQHLAVTRMLRRIYPSLAGLTLGVLGLTYKPGTSTLRRSPALAIIDQLTALGSQVKAYDPHADRRELGDSPGFEFCIDPYAVANDCDALVIVTEWPEFKELDFGAIRQSMRRPVLLDPQNMLDAEAMIGLGFRYLGIGRGSMATSDEAKAEP